MFSITFCCFHSLLMGKRHNYLDMIIEFCIGNIFSKCDITNELPHQFLFIYLFFSLKYIEKFISLQSIFERRLLSGMTTNCWICVEPVRDHPTVWWWLFMWICWMYDNNVNISYHCMFWHFFVLLFTRIT